GSDMTREHRPKQAGLGFAVGKKKTGYLGYEALEQSTTQQKMVSLTSELPHGAPEAGSPVRSLAGQLIGYTASSDFGYTVGKTITYAWLESDFAEPDTEVVITHFNRSIPAVEIGRAHV